MSNDQTLRDTFAAAALTGLIERRPWPVDKNESATICYQFADAMLRERGVAPAHTPVLTDAAPAARASESSCAGHAGTGGTTREPVAWLVLDADGAVWDVFLDADAARSCALDGVCVPLYRDSPPPTLTDAERKAIAHAVHFYSQDLSSRWATIADTLRALLARLGGAS